MKNELKEKYENLSEELKEIFWDMIEIIIDGHYRGDEDEINMAKNTIEDMIKK